MKFGDNMSAILPKCDLELVLLDCWSFGEVVKIRCPVPAIPTGKPSQKATPCVIPRNIHPEVKRDVITGNVHKINCCTVTMDRMPTSTRK